VKHQFVIDKPRISRRTVLAGCVAAGMVTSLPATARAPSPGTSANCPSLLQHRFARLQDGAPQDLCQYAGRVLLVVNTASYCGFTGQYRGLEDLFERYRARGLVVLGFPSNDFGRQEPGDAKAIADFCENTFGVRFPMFDKTVVSGPQAHPLYRELTRRTGQAPQWNFHKYLVSRDGTRVTSYPSAMEPNNPSLLRDLEKNLSDKS
jgi:glutathione peroxidase